MVTTASAGEVGARGCCAAQPARGRGAERTTIGAGGEVAFLPRDGADPSTRPIEERMMGDLSPVLTRVLPAGSISVRLRATPAACNLWSRIFPRS